MVCLPRYDLKFLTSPLRLRVATRQLGKVLCSSLESIDAAADPRTQEGDCRTCVTWRGGLAEGRRGGDEEGLAWSACRGTT
jgi:hypothetical protein